MILLIVIIASCNFKISKTNQIHYTLIFSKYYSYNSFILSMQPSWWYIPTFVEFGTNLIKQFCCVLQDWHIAFVECRLFQAIGSTFLAIVTFSITYVTYLT